MTDIFRKTVKSRLHEEVEGYTGSCFHRTKDEHLNASFRNVVHEGQRSQIVRKVRTVSEIYIFLQQETKTFRFMKIKNT